jgi:hypothetical protein
MQTDAKIDDIELHSKTALVAKQTPLTLMNQLNSKWKAGSKYLTMNEFWESKDPSEGRAIWNCRVGLKDHCIVGVASDFNKKRAQTIAS